jgi:hypothetical protein
MTKFLNVKNIGEKLITSSLEDNIKSFLDWGFLNINSFVNVNIPETPSSNPNTYTLKPVNDPSVPNNSIWESSKKDWVYESNLNLTGQNPIPITGIYINNTFFPNFADNAIGDLPQGNNSYRINYKLGQVIFPVAKPANLNIKLNYSYRYIQVYKSNENLIWKELLTYGPSDYLGGDKKITSDHRVEIPSIIIEVIPRMYQTPYELGNVKNIITQDVLLHVFADNPTQRSTIVDILTLQKDKDSYLYNINNLIKDQVYGLNANGTKNSNGLNYDQIIASDRYRANAYYIENSITTEYNQYSINLYNAVVRWTLKIYP